MVYVISDLHGNMKRWKSIKKQIQLQPEDRLYILGDVIDRYPDGIKILREIMRTPNMIMLKGNHEYMMQKYFETGGDSYKERLWYHNGGYCTHHTFKYYSNEFKKELLDYITALPLNIDIEVSRKNYLLVHGAPLETYDLFCHRYASPEEFAVWYRFRPSDVLYLDKMVIYGHTPVFCCDSPLPAEIMFHGDRIDVDCGSGYQYGRLACLRLDDMAVFYSD